MLFSMIFSISWSEFHNWAHIDLKVEIQNWLILLSIDNSIANISFYIFSRPKLKFWRVSDLSIIFLSFKTREFWFNIMHVLKSYSVPIFFVYVLLLPVEILYPNFWIFVNSTPLKSPWSDLPLMMCDWE